MKKLMIAAAIALTAIVTQATSVNWQVAGILIPVADDVTKDQSGISVAYGVNTPFAANALTLNLYYNDKSDGTGNWQSVGSYKNDMEGAFSDYQQVWSQAEASGIISAVGGNTVYLMYDATYETADGVYTYSSEALKKNISKAAAGTSNIYYDFDMPDGTWNYTANPVPEPTSGLLLLLGMAGLALRRRRA